MKRKGVKMNGYIRSQVWRGQLQLLFVSNNASLRDLWTLVGIPGSVAIETVWADVQVLFHIIGDLFADSWDYVLVQELQECGVVRILFLWINGRLSGDL